MATPNPPQILTTPASNGTPHRNDYPPSATSSPATLRSAASLSSPQPSQQLNPPSDLGAQPCRSEPTPHPFEAAVAERNSLSAQNTQLWKLIEKQRSGYNHIMKELERMRGERDLYCGRCQHLGENMDMRLRAHCTREKAEGKDSSALRSASSHSQLRPSESAAGAASSKGGMLDPWAHLTRTSSDESPARPRQLSSSRSFDPAQNPRTPERKGSTGTLQYPRSDSPAMLFSSSTQYLSASQVSSSSQSSAPNAVPTPSPLSQSTSDRGSDTNTRRSPQLTQSPMEDSFQQQQQKTSVPARSDSPSVSSTPVLSPSTATRPTRTDSNDGADPVLGTQPERTENPAINGRGHAVLPNDGSARGMTTSQPNGHSASHPRPPPISPPPPHPVVITVNGEANLSVRVHTLSQDSQISQLEEAKWYYASMVSPAVSPAMKFSFASGPSSPLKQETAQAGSGLGSRTGTPEEGSSAPGPNGTVLSSNGSLTQTQTQTQVRGRGWTNGCVAGSHRAGSVTTTESGAEFLNMDNEDSATPAAPAGRQLAADDLPLPPAASTHADAGASVQAHPGWASAPPPLLAEDLPYTEVVVATSIRPNDRGKEVLSFIISVDPGRGKDAWKIEKLYSDVLGLDTHVRAAVGRSAAKRLTSLPEGRLWRNYAPAKVYQRKAALEAYLRSLITLPVKNKDKVVAFFTSDIV
ncbi:hypothetical protein C8Q78DRAFT_1084067 [Trametes maxima]|nr:hypothetical protein C8Q78DRAFT_1084067 [Trametes maxima]